MICFWIMDRENKFPVVEDENVENKVFEASRVDLHI
jgi:hypothetical protein